MDKGKASPTLPKLLRTGTELTARHMNGIRDAIATLSARRVEGGRMPNMHEDPPFSVWLRYKPAGDDGPAKYFVTVSKGLVCELDRVQDNTSTAIILHAPPMIMDGTYLREHEIAVDQAVFVRVTENANGKIAGLGADPAVEIVIEAKDTISTNYVNGYQPARYYYKLAELTTIDSVDRLTHYLSGSHIYHETGLTADFILTDCPTYPDPANRLARLAFLSGRLVGIDETDVQRALSDNVSETAVYPCT